MSGRGAPLRCAGSETGWVNDEASTRNDVSGAVSGSVVQAGSIGHVTVHSPPTETTRPVPAAMFSMRGDIRDFVEHYAA